MLAPLLTTPRTASGFSLLLGRGQLVGLISRDWEKLFNESVTGARPDKLPPLQMRLSPGEPLPLLGAVEQPLLMAISPAPVADGWWHRLLETLESRAQMGGGAILYAVSLPNHNLLTRCIALDTSDGLEESNILDDAGQPVRHLRSGEWGSLRFTFPPGKFTSQGQLQLRLGGAQGEFLSSPMELSGWLPQLLAPQTVLASFATPGVAGNFRARLLLDGHAIGQDIQFSIKPAAFETRHEGFHVDWQLSPTARLSAIEAARIHEPPAPAVLQLGADGGQWLSGDWFAPEPWDQGKWRRWTSGCAVWRAKGKGRATVHVEDHRPRSPEAQPVTRAEFFLDGRPCAEFLLDQPGAHCLEFSWPDDDMNHSICLKSSPLWSPAALGIGEDARSLGLLVTSSEISGG